MAGKQEEDSEHGAIPKNGVVVIECSAEFLQRVDHLLVALEAHDNENTKSALWPNLGADREKLRTVKPGAQIKLTLPVRAIPVFAGLRFVQLRLEMAPAAQEESLIRWTALFKKCRKVWKEQAINETLATAFECCVLLRMRLAGYRAKFIPSNGTRTRTPDIVCEAPRFLVECKDCQGTQGYDGDVAKVVKWIKRRIKDARDQLLVYDPELEYRHIVCLDMPEQFAVNPTWQEPTFVRRFLTKVFTLKNRAKNPSPEDGNVFFTSFDFNQHWRWAKGERNEPRHEAWYRQILDFGGDPVVERLLLDIRLSLNPAKSSW